jgi:CRP-like cAMP-binding protein
MLGKDTKIGLLQRVPLFAGCSRAELGKIASVADELALPEGRELTKEGSSGREFVVLVEGAADVRRKGKLVNRLGAGDFAGEIALVSGEPRTATVTTTKPSRVLLITARDFRMLLRETPSLQLKVLSALAARIPPEYQ